MVTIRGVLGAGSDTKEVVIPVGVRTTVDDSRSTDDETGGVA